MHVDKLDENIKKMNLSYEITGEIFMCGVYKFSLISLKYFFIIKYNKQ